MAITTTARTLINGAFDLLQVKGSGETVQAADLTDALRRLQAMIDSWALQPGTITNQVREVFDLVASQASYTMGPGGNFDTVRPVYVQGAGLLMNAPSVPVEVPLTLLSDDAYDALAVKTLTSVQPTCVYVNATSPLATVILWPVPTTAVNDLVLYSLQAFAGFTSVDQAVHLPTGYAEPIEYNLAKRLATPYGLTWPAELDAIARSSLAWVKTSNRRISDLSLDAALVQESRAPWNILAGP